jgi:hypothetical protein
MLSTLFYVASLMNGGVGASGFVDLRMKSELIEGSGAPTGALIVKMGPVMNVRVDVEDVRVVTGRALASLPAIARKRSLFEGFSHNRVYAIRYGR